MDLFSNDGMRDLHMEGGSVLYHPRVDFGIPADEILKILTAEIPWSQRQTRWGPEPRMTSWHADDGISYRYSGITMSAHPMSTLLDGMRQRLQDLAGASFNSVLLNLYRDGQDSIGFHADDEPELGRDPTIASVSLGAERVFELKRKDGTGHVHKISLEHGSVIVMAGATQRNWLHGIRKVKASVGPRINLTFRRTFPR